MAARARTSGVSGDEVWAGSVPVHASISTRMIGGTSATLCIRHTRLDYKATLKSKRLPSWEKSLTRRERVRHQAMGGRVRGAKILLSTPHPPLRCTLSLRGRDSVRTTTVVQELFHVRQGPFRAGLTRQCRLKLRR